MGRVFRPLEPLRGWRKLAVHTWRTPRDPSTYAMVDVEMDAALAYCERLRSETGVHVTVTHLTVHGVALALKQFPQMNGIVARGRIMLRDTVDIFMQVATSGGAELSGVKIANAPRRHRWRSPARRRSGSRASGRAVISRWSVPSRFSTACRRASWGR